MWLAYLYFWTCCMFLRLNLAVRLSNLLHLLYSGWDRRICVDSDFWQSQLHLVRYCWPSFLWRFFAFNYIIISALERLLKLFFLSVWYLLSSHWFIFLSIHQKPMQYLCFFLHCYSLFLLYTFTIGRAF